jgi:hypothetical protein
MRFLRRTARPKLRLVAEALEPRQMLSVSTIAPSLIPAEYRLPVAGAAAETSSVTVDSSIPVGVVRSADPLFGYDFTITTPQRAYGYEMVPSGQRVGAAVGVDAVAVPAGSILRLEVLSGLVFWNGRGTPSFAAAGGGTEINLQVGGQNLRVGGRTDQALGQPGAVRRSIDIGVADGMPLTRHIQVTIGSGGVRDAFARSSAPAGIYAVTGLWSVGGVREVRDSAPVTLVFSVGTVPAAARAAAVASFQSVQTRPVAIVAVAAEAVAPDGPRQPFLRITVQYSDPVSVTGRPPRLPVFFDRNVRLVDLAPDSPRTDTDTLSFTLIPTPQERAAIFIRLGSALRVPAGGAIRSTAGGPAIPSLTPEFAGGIPIDLREQVATITADIARNTTFRRGTTYVIDGEIHVLRGVTLTIEDGVTVLIRNGYRVNRLLNANALIFDSGSALKAATVTFAAADETNRITPFANNGGVFFLGTARSCSKDGVSVNAAMASGRSSFNADMIIASYLGRTDPLGRGGDGHVRGDIDAISILGMGQTEWRIKGVRSEYSGDDGFDATKSSITLDRLTVIAPVEDGLNVTSSIVDIRRELVVTMTPSRVPDRELFDLEVDDGPARVIIARLAAVDLRGYWGNVYDEVGLNSPDMPRPPRRGGESQWYVFNGTLRKGPAIVYALKAD